MSALPQPGSDTITSAQWRRVAGDPVVQRIQEAVEGTLFHVRKVKPREDSDPGDAPAGEAVDESR